MSEYNPFKDFNPAFTKYEYLEPLTYNDPLFGELSANGFNILPNGNWVAPINLKQEETLSYYDTSFLDEMAARHSELISNNSSTYNNIKNSKKAVQIMNKLLKLDSDLTPELAAGIVGQINVESSLNFGNSNPNDLGRASKGAILWNGDRFNSLKEFAKSKSKSWTDEDVLLEFLILELKTKFPQNYNLLRQSTTAEDAAEALSSYVKYAGYDGTLNSARTFQRTNKLSDELVYAHIKKEKLNRRNSAFSVYNLWKNQS